MLEGGASVERIVVDSPVAAKRFVAEKSRNKALRLKDSYLSGRLELGCFDASLLRNGKRVKVSFVL